MWIKQHYGKVLFVFWEAWIGKNKWKSNSTLALIINIFISIMGIIKKGFKMTGILDGKEVDVKIGEVGSVSIDVSKDGAVKFELIASKELEGVKLQTASSAEVHLFVILEKQCLKNNKTWDEAVIAQVKMILGLVG